MDIDRSIIEKLQQLTGHKHVTLTPRGNAAIKAALKISGKGKVLIPDQGGWLTYHSEPGKLEKELFEIKTDNALLDLDDLRARVDADSVLLYANPGGYFVEQSIKEIYEICNKQGALVILDASGGIGTDMCDGRYADIIIGSFGRWKPVNAHYGGFISSDTYDLPEFLVNETKLPEILAKLEGLPERIKFLEKKRKQVIEDLSAFNVVHPKSRGYVVVVAGDNEELEKVKNYCGKNRLEYTECPRYIRILEKAVSIEVKRL